MITNIVLGATLIVMITYFIAGCIIAFIEESRRLNVKLDKKYVSYPNNAIKHDTNVTCGTSDTLRPEDQIVFTCSQCGEKELIASPLTNNNVNQYHWHCPYCRVMFNVAEHLTHNHKLRGFSPYFD